MISWFDLFVAFFLLASAVWSYLRGFIREVFSLASLVGGAYVGFKYYGKTAPLFAKLIQDKTFQEIAAFTLLFVLTAIAVSLTGMLVRRILHLSHALNTIDRIAGLGVGIIKGALILTIITYPLILIPGLQDELAKGSRTAPALIGMSWAIMEKVSPDLAKSLDRAAQKAGDVKDRAEQAERYRKKLDELEKGASSLKEKLGIDKDAGKNKKGKEDDKISERDREQLDKLIEKLDKN